MSAEKKKVIALFDVDRSPLADVYETLVWQFIPRLLLLRSRIC